MANITVSQAISRLEREMDSTLGEISGDLFLDWLNDLNFLLHRILIKADPEMFIEEDTTTTVVGTTTYALPLDFKHIKATNCGFYVENKKLPRTVYGSSKEGYRLRGSKFIITAPTVAYDIVLRYIPKLTKLTALTNTMVVDFEDYLTVINYLEQQYGKWNIDILKETNANQRFLRDLEQMFGNNIRENKIYNLSSRV